MSQPFPDQPTCERPQKREGMMVHYHRELCFSPIAVFGPSAFAVAVAEGTYPIRL